MGELRAMPSGKEYEGFSDALTPAVLRAAAIAHSMEGRVRNRPKSGEEDAVKQALTEADTAAQEAILESLVDLYPHVSLAAEEDTPTVARFPSESAALVIIDPIDGTLRSYLEARGPYAVIVGLAIERKLRAALVSLPREGVLFAADRRSGARLVSTTGATRDARARADGDRVLVSHNMPKRVIAALGAEGLSPVPACGGAIAIAPLLRGVRAGLRYYGGKRKRGISVRGRVGALIAREGGAHVRGDGGDPFPDHLDVRTRTLRACADEADLAVLDKALAAAGLD